MRKFDTKVQHLKYKVLREVAKQAWDDTLLDNLLEIPKKIVPGNMPTMRCCVYKERAILGDRVRLAMGGDKENPNVLVTNAQWADTRLPTPAEAALRIGVRTCAPGARFPLTTIMWPILINPSV